MGSPERRTTSLRRCEEGHPAIDHHADVAAVGAGERVDRNTEVGSDLGEDVTVADEVHRVSERGDVLLDGFVKGWTFGLVEFQPAPLIEREPASVDVRHPPNIGTIVVTVTSLPLIDVTVTS